MVFLKKIREEQRELDKDEERKLCNVKLIAPESGVLNIFGQS